VEGAAEFDGARATDAETTSGFASATPGLSLGHIAHLRYGRTAQNPARIRVARCTNLVRTLKDYAAKGLMIAGLDADGTTNTDDFELATSPLVIVVGSEGRGLARLTLTVCDVTVSIPMARTVESLNASVAAGVVLAEVARRRRIEAGG